MRVKSLDGVKGALDGSLRAGAACTVHHEVNLDAMGFYPHGAHHAQFNKRHPERRMDHISQYSIYLRFSDHRETAPAPPGACE